MARPIRVAVTGAAGNVGYALIFRLAAGDVFGPEQEIELSLVEIPAAMQALEGVALELEDCAFPLLASVRLASDPRQGFADARWAVLVGSKPRAQGAERSDLIKDNAPLFVTQGQALNDWAAPEVRVTVVGNPANLNCAVACQNAPDIPDSRFTALTRLDHNRTVAQLAAKAQVGMERIRKVAIWGNHSSTQYPCIAHAEIDGHRSWPVFRDEGWIRNVLVPTVQNRGAAIIAKRGQSSAASAAQAVVDHLRDWHLGTPDGELTSMGIKSQGLYGTPRDVFFSFPVTIAHGEVTVVPGLPLDAYDRRMIHASADELVGELETAKEVMGQASRP